MPDILCVKAISVDEFALVTYRAKLKPVHRKAPVCPPFVIANKTPLATRSLMIRIIVVALQSSTKRKRTKYDEKHAQKTHGQLESSSEPSFSSPVPLFSQRQNNLEKHFTA